MSEERKLFDVTSGTTGLALLIKHSNANSQKALNFKKKKTRGNDERLTDDGVNIAKRLHSYDMRKSLTRVFGEKEFTLGDFTSFS